MLIVNEDFAKQNSGRVTFTEQTESYIPYFRFNKEAMDLLGNPDRIDFGIQDDRIYFIPNESGLVKIYNKSQQASATKVLKCLHSDIFPQCYVMLGDDKGYYIEVDFM